MNQAGDSSGRTQLRELLKKRSVRTGDFVLSSGARSTFYVDARLTTMSGAGQALIGSVCLLRLDQAKWSPAAVGGLTLGADPVAYAIAHAAARAGRDIDAFTVRKEPKTHGTSRLVEGPLPLGGDVVIVEDVVTTGDSALRAIRAVLAAGSHVLGVLALVDRSQGGREKLAQEGYDLASIFDIRELLEATSS